jgi:hypothetical protein
MRGGRTRADAGPSIGSEDGLDRKEYKTKDKECMKCDRYTRRLLSKEWWGEIK